MQQGYIKLHRQLKESWIWKEKEPFDKRSAWIDLLLMANHKDNKMFFEGKLIVVKKGQFITSIQKLSAAWNWDRKKVMRFLDVLEGDGMITQNRTTHGTTITIVNWELFQCGGTADGTSHGTTDGQPVDTNNNDKNVKNEKKYMRSQNNDKLKRLEDYYLQEG